MSALLTKSDPSLSQPQSHRGRVAAALDRWAGAPHRAHTRIALLGVAVAVVAVLALTWNLPDRTMILRAVGLMFFVVHVLANRAILAWLGWLDGRGMKEAGRALDAYLAPGRLTSLEIGMIWIALAAFAPLFDLIAPTAPLAG